VTSVKISNYCCVYISTFPGNRTCLKIVSLQNCVHERFFRETTAQETFSLQKLKSVYSHLITNKKTMLTSWRLKQRASISRTQKKSQNMLLSCPRTHRTPCCQQSLLHSGLFTERILLRNKFNSVFLKPMLRFPILKLSQLS